MMVLKNTLYSLLFLAVVLVPSAYAGKVELTTYYPAPYGEYSELNASKSFIPPRMTTAQRDAIDTTSNPPLAQGMVVFNTTTNQLEINRSADPAVADWVSGGGGGGGIKNVYTVVGNAGYSLNPSPFNVWNTFPDLTISNINTSAPAYLMIVPSITMVVGGGNCGLRLNIDGNPDAVTFVAQGAGYGGSSASITRAIEVGPGNHTVSVEFNCNDNYSYSSGVNSGRSVTVMEFSK